MSIDPGRFVGTCFCSLVNPFYFLSCRIESDSHIENLILEGILRLLSLVLGVHSRGQWPGLLLGPCPVLLEQGLLLCSPSHITHFPSLTLFTFSISPQTPLQPLLHCCLLCDYPLCPSSKLHTLHHHLCAWASLWSQYWEPVLNAHAPAGVVKVRGCPMRNVYYTSRHYGFLMLLTFCMQRPFQRPQDIRRSGILVESLPSQLWIFPD